MRTLSSAVSLFVVGLCACTQPLDIPEDLSIRMRPADFVTNQAPDVPIVIQLSEISPWQTFDEFIERELPAWHASSRVVRWPSREPVEGRWVFSVTDLTLTFEPVAPLPEGWFALQVRFSDLPVRRGTVAMHAFEIGVAPQYWDDGWVTTRFHVGSLPTFQIWGGLDPGTDGHDPGGMFTLGATEAVVLDADVPLEGLLTVTLDGERVDCAPTEGFGPLLLAQGYPFSGITWTCPDVPHAGRVEVSLRPLEGTPPGTRYVGQGTPPTWIGETGNWFSAQDVPDSFFLADEVRP